MIENRDSYKTRVVGYGQKLNRVRTPDGVLHIDVRDVPNCTWELEGDTFFCAHDETEIEDGVEDHMGFEGHYQTEYTYYICADPDCEEPLEGSPAEDAYERMVDAQIDEAREYGS